MRTRLGLLASVLSCTVLLAAYETQPISARAVSSQSSDVDISEATSAAKTLAPGEFRFTTGLDKEPQHIQGPVTCDTRDDIHRILIGRQDAGGVEIGLSSNDTRLTYADLGNRNGVDLMLFNDPEIEDGSNTALPSVRKIGNTYVASGYATGTTASHQTTQLYFEISVACP